MQMFRKVFLNLLRLQQLILVYETLMSIAREYQQRKNFAENAIFAEVTIIRNVEVNARAKDKICNNCGKIGPFQRVCRSPTKSAVASALSSEIDSLTNENQPEVTKPPQLLSVVAGVPACLSQTVLSVKVNGIELKGLLDTGASESFVNEGIAEIAKLHLEGKPSRVSMASDNLMAPTFGKVSTSLKVQGRDYPNVMLGVMPGLCAAVALGQDFLRRHKEVIVKLDGPRDTLLVNNDPFCGM